MSKISHRTPLLLVDDDAMFIQSMKIFFKHFQDEFEVHIAKSVAEAIAILASHPIELAILDVYLHDGTAADVIRAAGAIPCILCTRDLEGAAFAKMFSDHSITQNVVGFITKPLYEGVIWNIRAGLRVGMERKEQNRLVAEATAQLEDERKIIAQVLHDEMGTYLTQFTWMFGNLESAVKDAQELTESLRNNLGDIANKGNDLTTKAHAALSAIVSRLRSEVVNVAGLHIAIEHLIFQWEESAPTVRFKYEATGDFDKVDLRRSDIIYRIVQEGITNAMRHTIPVSIQVSVTCREKDLEICVRSVGSVLHERGHYKLTSLRERTASLGGVLYH